MERPNTKGKMLKLAMGEQRVDFVGEIFFVKKGSYTGEAFNKEFSEKLQAHGVDGFDLIDHILKNSKMKPVDANGRQIDSADPVLIVKASVEKPSKKSEEIEKIEDLEE